MAIYTVLEPPDGKPDRVAFVPKASPGARSPSLSSGPRGTACGWWRPSCLRLIAALSAAISLELLDAATGSLIQLGWHCFSGSRHGSSRSLRWNVQVFAGPGSFRPPVIDAAELAYFAERASASLPLPPRAIVPVRRIRLGFSAMSEAAR